MEALEFKKLLFKTAFCCIACDGHIDEKEIEEMKFIDKKTAYFEDVDLSKELDELVQNVKTKGKQIVDDLFNDLVKVELDIVQELLLLEVTLRLIYSDEKIEENEIRFLKYLRSKLKVYDEIIMDRFGTVDLLFDKQYSNFFHTNDQQKELVKEYSVPEFKDLESIDLKRINANK